MWQVQDEAWHHGFFSGREALRDYLLSNPGCDFSSLDLGSLGPSLIQSSKAGPTDGQQLIKKTFGETVKEVIRHARTKEPEPKD